jgi:hypothetical protein
MNRHHVVHLATARVNPVPGSPLKPGGSPIALGERGPAAHQLDLKATRLRPATRCRRRPSGSARASAAKSATTTPRGTPRRAAPHTPRNGCARRATSSPNAWPTPSSTTSGTASGARQDRTRAPQDAARSLPGLPEGDHRRPARRLLLRRLPQGGATSGLEPRRREEARGECGVTARIIVAAWLLVGAALVAGMVLGRAG